MSEVTGEVAVSEANSGSEEQRQRAPSIPAATFVQEWQKAPTLRDAMDVLGKNASLRASALRKRGINLKKFPTNPKGRAKLDIQALNELADEALNK